ncbi:Hypothetical protein A7982_09673 [Minicystis rosea]|nr:Hypothetical protein A7982_09673 [Minicystis rosea]
MERRQQREGTEARREHDGRPNARRARRLPPARESEISGSSYVMECVVGARGRPIASSVPFGHARDVAARARAWALFHVLR